MVLGLLACKGVALWREGLRRRETCHHSHSGSAVLGTAKLTLPGMALGLLTWKGEDAGTVGVCGWIYRPHIYPYCQGNGTSGLSQSRKAAAGTSGGLSPPSPQGHRHTHQAFALTLAHADPLPSMPF